MKQITVLSLALTIGLCLQAPSLFAQDQSLTKPDTKGTGDSVKGAKAAPDAAKQFQIKAEQTAVSRDEKADAKVSANGADATNRLIEGEARNTQTTSQSVQQINQTQSQQTQPPAFAVQGNMGNHFNGRWSAANSHSDWDQSINHSWNNQNYQWYDGGWLMIDVNASPDSVTAGSVNSDVQQSLARQGYYNGPIDGFIGRGTRRAISNYEAANGLQVNGRIDGPLLVSLKLE